MMRPNIQVNASLVPIVAWTFCTLFISSCRLKSENLSDLQYIGVPEVDESQWPEVRKLLVFSASNGIPTLRETCTAVFTRPNQALTAAHCVCHASLLTVLRPEGMDELQVKEAAIHPQFNCEAKVPNHYDLALLTFESDVKMPFLRLATRALDRGAVVAIGYGDHILLTQTQFPFYTSVHTRQNKPRGYVNGRDFEGKRVVTAEFEGHWVEGFYRFESYIKLAGDGWKPSNLAAARGDSGGPLINKKTREIIGIMSRGGFKPVHNQEILAVSDFVNILLQPNIKFITEHSN